MRKTLAILLSALMLVSLLSFPSFAAEGTAINTAAEFLAMDPAGTYYLNADITLDTRYGYVDDSNTTPFTGILDGNGHTITTSDCIFETLNGATITNLTIAGNVVIANGGTRGSGVLARRSESGATLEKITNNATLSLEVVEGNAYVGTLIGAVTKGYLIVTDCVNNGKITIKTNFNFNGKTDVAPRIGGLTGNVAKDVVPVFTGCVNNADIELFDTSVDANGDPIVSTGASYLGGITSDCFTGTFIKCVNNGNLSANVPIDGAGICGRTPPSKQLDDHSVSYSYCVNNGDVTTSAKSSRAIGGIQGYAGASGVTACYKIWNCTNTGNISYTGPATGNAGGLAGYVYASGATEYVDVAYNVNLGDVSCPNGTAFVSEFVGYSNSSSNKVYNNIGLGKLNGGTRDAGEGASAVLNCFIGVSSAAVNGDLCQSNFIIDTAGVNFYSWAADATKNAAQRIAIADAPAGSVTFVTEAQVKSGEVAYLANQAAGSDVFFQTIGTDNVPVTDETHGKVYQAANGYTNTATEAPTAEPTAAPTAEPTAAPTAAPTEPKDEPTAAPTEAQDQPTEPAATNAPETKAAEEKKGCKSVVSVGVVLVAIVGCAVVSKKKF